MRFGKSYEELNKYHRWFAWYPVHDYETGISVLFEFVMRKKDGCSYKYKMFNQEPKA